MKITLKNISYSARLSQETNAFAADIYVDGVKAGSCENSGHGGNTTIHFNDAKLLAQAEAYAKSLPPLVTDDFTLPMKLEILIDELFEDWLQKKETARQQNQLKRWCKKETLFRLQGDEKGSWRTVKALYSPDVKQFIIRKYGDRVETILNETLAAG